MPFFQSLQKGRFIVTSEVQVSVESDTDALVRELTRVKGRVNGVVVSEVEIEGVTCDSLPLCSALKQAGYDPVLETAVRERNRIEIQSHLMRAADAGITNLLTFTRDYRITGDSLNEMMFFHVDSAKLFSVLNSLREGVDVKGKDLQRAYQFFLGAGIDSSWGRKVPDMELKEIDQMAGMGTGFFLTTPVFDLNEFSQFYGRVREFGVPVVAEVILIRSAGMAHFMNKYIRPNLVPGHMIQRLLKAADKEQVSIEIFGELVKGLREICDGIHILPVGAEERVGTYLNVLKE